jgi:thiol:disulfide interchange protein
MRMLLVALLFAGCKKESTEAKPASESAPAAAKVTATASGWVDADPATLAETLSQQAAAASKAGKKPFAYLHADWCGPCNAIEKTKGDPKMVAAFANTHIITIDVDRADAKALAALGMSGSVIPVFYRLDDSGKVTGAKIDGGAWGDNIPDNMAPPLAAFFAQ